MATLELRKTSNWWYGRWSEKGTNVVNNLNVRVEGRRPEDKNDPGDRRFRTSREIAQAKLDQLIRESEARKHVEGLAQTIHRARTGRRVGSVKIGDMKDAWLTIPRRQQTLSTTYVADVKGTFQRFDSFVSDRFPDVNEMAEVTENMAQAFLAYERNRGVSGRTFNITLSRLKGAFRNLRRQAGIVDNPFDGIIGQDENTVHRIPYTPEELQAILEVAHDDDFCRPLIVTGICTAMRLGDVCQLRWCDVEMDNGFITVDTSKTGARVSIPLFPMLHEELAKLSRTSEYCFPEQAEIYQTRPDTINTRLRRVFTAAGFSDGDETKGTGGGKPKKAKAAKGEVLSEDEMLRRGRDRIQTCTSHSDAVRDRMLEVFELYMAGGTINSIREELEMSKGGISEYFKRIEAAVGFPVIRSRRPKPCVKKRAPMLAQRQGLRRVNRRGFHAFRATWVTLALTAGVPVDLVKKVTGHTTVDTVLTHYYQPGREDFRRTLQAAMPALLTNGAPTRDEQIRTIVEGMTSQTFGKDRERLLALLDNGTLQATD